MRYRALLCAVATLITLGARADQHFIYFEAEQATVAVNTAFRDQGFTHWMGHPSNGRTVIFGGADGALRFSLDGLPSGGEYWVYVRHLAFAAPDASVEGMVGDASLGITEFAHHGSYLAWSKALGPFAKENGAILTLRPAKGSSQAPYVDVVLVTNKAGFIPDNIDQDFSSLVLRTDDNTLRFSGHAVSGIVGKTAVDLRVENTTDDLVVVDFVVTVTDPILQTRKQERSAMSIEPGSTKALHLPYDGETGRQYTVRTEVLNAEGVAFFFDTTDVKVVQPVAFTINVRTLSPGESAVVTMAVNDACLLTKDARFLLIRDDAPGQALPVQGATTEVRVAAKSLGEGEHILRARFEADAQYEAEFPVSVIPWPKDPLPDIERVAIEGQTILVNGKPFVPRKLYHARGSVLVKRQGFNAVDCWGGDSLDMVEQMLDEAHAANLYGYGVLFHEYFYKGIAEGYDLDALREGMTRLKDHPALLFWELYDEPDGGVPVEQLLEAYHLLQEVDPNHPVILNFCYPEKFREYGVAADIVSMDTYPIPERPVTTISEYMDSLGASVDYQKPLQVVLQTYGDIKGRMPTPQELRCMTYLAINHGARSTSFYSYAERKDYPYCLTADSILWSYVRQVNEELLSIMPTMAAPTFHGVISPSNECIDASARIDDDGLLLICVNTSGKTVKATITVEEEWSNITPLFNTTSNSAHEIRDGETYLSAAFEPLGVNLYRLK